MSDLIERLKARWVADGLTLRPGASPEALAAFEARYGVVAPSSLRDYFAAVDGMEDVMDGEHYRFWPLAEFVSMRDLREPGTDQRRWEGLPAWADHWFAFADFLVCSHAFAIRLTSDPHEGGPVCLWDFEEGRCPIAPTFDAFLELYLARSTDLFGSDAEILD